MKALVIAAILALTCILSRAQPGPGPEHEELKKLEGAWTAKIKMGEEESTGSITYKMELGGLWLVSNFKGQMGGQPFEGKGLDSYDPEKKKYVAVWFDSMGSKPLLMEGTHDKAKKTMTMTGEGIGPDGQTAKYKMVTHLPDNDHMTFKMYLVADGKENLMMTIDYTRKK